MPSLRTLALTATAVLVLTPTVSHAQFPINETFKNSSATGWNLLGNAILTSGNGTIGDATGAGWLRLTGATTSQAGSAIYNTGFSSSSGIVVTFVYADYGGTNADGFSFYLIDGTTASPTVGAPGGPLGYAAKYSNSSSTCPNTSTLTETNPGVTNGYVGIGFDEWGNFSDCQSGYNSPGQTAHSVVIHGSGSTTAKAFRYLTGTQISASPFSKTIDGVSRASARPIRISIINQKIKVEMDFGSGYQTVINQYDLSTATGQIAMPSTFKMGFSGSTGSYTNIHEIRNLVVTMPVNLTLGMNSSSGSAQVGDTITYTITVSNDATNAASNVVISDLLPAGLSNVTWTAAYSGGASATASSGSGNNLTDTLTMPKSSTITFTVTGTVSLSAAGTTLSNTVAVTTDGSQSNMLSSSSNTAVAVAQLPTTTTVSASSGTSTYGQSVTLSSTVTGSFGTPTGTVTFYDGATSLGTATLSSGSASLATGAISGGVRSLHATYNGDTNYTGSTSSNLSHTVNTASTSTSLATSGTPSTYGSTVTFTATVADTAYAFATPTGTVTFYADGTSIGTGTLSSGTATLTTTATTLAGGSHSITATYGGSSNYSSSTTSSALTQAVNKATPTLALVATPSTAVTGQAISLAATVSSAISTPTGTVTFYNGASSLGSSALVSGAATGSFTTGGPGTYTLQVAYSGNVSFLTGTNATATVTTSKANTSVTVASIVPASPYAGQSATITATVAVTAPGSGSPSGTVTFYDNGTSIGTAPPSGGGSAMLTVSFGQGSHSITAQYAGDSSFNGSALSGATALTVNKLATTTTLAANINPSAYGQSVTLTAGVSSTTGTPTGTVTFYDGGSSIGTGTLSSGSASLTVASLGVGAHTLTAGYGGATSYATSTSGIVPQTVNKAASSVSVGSSLQTSTYGVAVTFTATVSDGAYGYATPSGGTVTFYSDGTSIGTGTLSAGTASLSTSALTAGVHDLTAGFGGNTSYLASSSAAGALLQSVGKATPTVALVASPTTVVTGQSVGLTGTVSSSVSTPTGTVTFSNGGTSLGSGTLSSGSASGTFVPAVAGSPTIHATYSGDANFLAGTDGTAGVTVNKASTTATVASISPASPYPSQSATITATVAVTSPGSGSPSGTVTFFDNGTSIGTGALSGGSATLSTSFASGLHSITAQYGGDSSYNGSAASSPSSFTSNKLTTTTTLAANINPSVYGQGVTLTAGVSSGTGTPTGTVTFYDGGTSLGTGTLSSGSATLTVASLTVGTHTTLTASYGGTGTYATSTSSNLSQTVNKAASSVSVGSSLQTSTYGVGVTFTATVSDGSYGYATPSGGTVTFYSDGTSIGSGTLSAGTASFATSALTAGVHDITAAFGGNTSYLSSSSAAGALLQSVGKATPTVALVAAPSTVVTGQSVGLTATVSSSVSTPTGTVTFSNGGTSLGSGTLSSGTTSGTFVPATAGGVTLHATYSGNGNFLAGTDGTASVTVNKASTTTTVVSVSPASPYAGQSTTITAAVTVVSPGSGSPSGTVTFLDNGTSIGTGTLSSGSATLSTSFGTGSHSITAQYGGDTGYNGSTTGSPSSFTTNKLTTTTTLATDINPSVFGQGVKLTAGVSSGTGTPTGTVTFYDGGSSIGTGTLSSGSASLTVASLAVGTRTLTASYGGTASYATSSSGSVSQTVNKAASSVSVGSSLQTSTYGVAVTFTATVSDGSYGYATPSGGTVTFYSDGASIGTGTLSSGTATFTTSALSAGVHDVTAGFGGNSGYLASTSTAGALLQVVDKATATVSLVATASPVFGQPVTLTGTVSSNAGTPTGTLAFSVDGSALGSPTTLVSGGATASFTPSTVRTYALSVAYSGDSNFNVGAGSVSLDVGKGGTTTVVAAITPSPSYAGQPVNLTATVAVASPATGTPSGSVTFYDGGTALGTVALGGDLTASTSATFLQGTHSVTAQYLGDGAFLGSTSAVQTQPVTLGVPAAVSVVSGSGQETVVATAFAQPLTVKVVDQDGAAVPLATVTFAAPGSGATASLGAATAVTDASGLASVSASAGTGAGGYAVTASVADVVTPASFSLTNDPGAPATLTADSSAATQTAQAGTVFAASLGATVTDAYGNPVPNVTVTFAAPASGPTASLAQTTAATDAQGRASVAATAGSAAGTYAVVASISTGHTAQFELTNSSDAPSTIALVSGDGQHATVGTAYGASLVIVVRDQYGNPVPAVPVNFTAPSSGATAGLTLLAGFTDSNGLLDTSATASTVAGAFQVVATATGASSPVAFSLENRPGTPTAIAAEALTVAQIAQVGTAFALPLAVLVTDTYGNPVPGVQVTWTAPGSGPTAALDATTATTGADGVASVGASAGSVAGSYTVGASIDGVGTVASFSLTNQVGAVYTMSVASGSPQSAVVATAYAAALEVLVHDQYGNPVPGVAVTFSAPASGASVTFTSTSVTTGADGKASGQATAGTVAGTFHATASGAGASAPVQFALENLPGQAVRLVTAPDGSGQSAQVGELFPNALTVTAVDAYGNPVPGVTVTFGCPSTATTCEVDPTSAVTGADGTAGTRATAGTVSGSVEVTASAPGLDPVSFSLTSQPGQPGAVEVVSGSNQTAPANSAYGNPLEVKVTDPYGNPVVGAVVTFQVVTTSGQTVTLSSETAITDANGVAKVTATSSGTPGNVQVVATVPGTSSPVIFTLTTVAAVAQLTVDIGLPVFGTVIQGDGVSHVKVAVGPDVGGVKATGTITLRSSRTLRLVPGQANASQSEDAIVVTLVDGAIDVAVIVDGWRSRTLQVNYTPDAAAAGLWSAASTTVDLTADQQQQHHPSGCAAGDAGWPALLAFLLLGLGRARRSALRAATRGALVAGLLLAAAPRPALAQFETGLRLGWAFPVGNLQVGNSLSNYLSGTLPIQLEVGYRILPPLSVGGYFSWGPAHVAASLCGGASCSGSTMRLGVQGSWRFVPLPFLGQGCPWAGGGLGMEWLHASAKDSGGTLEVSMRGMEILNLQGGVDWSVADRFTVGPYLQLATGRYAHIEVQSPLGNSSGGDPGANTHLWLTLGIRATFDVSR